MQMSSRSSRRSKPFYVTFQSQSLHSEPQAERYETLPLMDLGSTEFPWQTH